MEPQEQEDVNQIEHYLQTLRKKVQHQIKNPFELPFASFTFEELLNWKNNILQLDTTSRLYGQRVDFLHNGTMRILGTFINNQQAIQPQKQIEVTTSTIPQTNIFQKFLEPPQKIDIQIKTHKINQLLWREIMKKRDTLPLLMLNQLALNNNLELTILQNTNDNAVHFYQPIFIDQTAMYLQLVDFKVCNSEMLYFFTLCESFISELNRDILSIKLQRKEQSRQFITSDWDNLFVEFQTNYNPTNQNFNNIEQHITFDHECQNQHQNDILQFNINPIKQIEYINPDDDLSSQSNFSIYTISDIGDTAKAKAIRKNTAVRKKKINQHLEIFFHGIVPKRSQYLLLPNTQKQLQTDRYLLPKDHLLLKIFKYSPPFRKNRKNQQTIQPVVPFNQPIGQNYSYFDTAENSQFRLPVQHTNLSLTNNGVTQFKQAVLMIKQMKQLIRSTISVNKSIQFFKLTEKLQSEEPLDIFITALHIAAEEGTIMIR